MLGKAEKLKDRGQRSEVGVGDRRSECRKRDKLLHSNKLPPLVIDFALPKTRLCRYQQSSPIAGFCPKHLSRFAWRSQRHSAINPILPSFHIRKSSLGLQGKLKTAVGRERGRRDAKILKSRDAERLKSLKAETRERLFSVLSNEINKGYKDRNDFVCLPIQVSERTIVDSAIVSKEFEPEKRFVGLLNCAVEFRT